MLQYSSCGEFNSTFLTVGGQFANMFSVHNLMLYLNALVNKGLSLLLPLFNIYFMLLSETPNDALLNGLALFFILEMDEMVLPSWDGERVSDELACHCHDFIMQPSSEGELVVTKTGAMLEYQHTDRLYVRLQRTSDGLGKVYVHKQESRTEYSTSIYEIKGSKAKEFLDAVQTFECLQNFRDLHD